MPPAAAIDEDQLGIPLQTSLMLSTSRAFISLSQKLCWDFEIIELDTQAESAAIKSGAQVQLAHVFKQSIHYYCLRKGWLWPMMLWLKTVLYLLCHRRIWSMPFLHSKSSASAQVNHGIFKRKFKAIAGPLQTANRLFQKLQITFWR